MKHKNLAPLTKEEFINDALPFQRAEREQIWAQWELYMSDPVGYAGFASGSHANVCHCVTQA